MNTDKDRTVTLALAALVLPLALAGCSSTQRAGNEAEEIRMAPQMSERAAAILADNAIQESPGMVRLGAGDRFGRHVVDRHMVLVRARQESGGATLATVPISKD